MYHVYSFCVREEILLLWDVRSCPVVVLLHLSRCLVAYKQLLLLHLWVVVE